MTFNCFALPQFKAMHRALVRKSKFLSLILRHAPETIGLSLDANGWANVAEIIDRAPSQNMHYTRDEINEIVATNEKRRFALNSDGTKIRASQGHSIAVDVELPVLTPPEQLYHGTAIRHLASIQATGLRPGNRNHVHLSADRETAIKVGQRHGKPVVLTVLAQALSEAGTPFYQSANGVWLVDAVPVNYLQFPT